MCQKKLTDVSKETNRRVKKNNKTCQKKQISVSKETNTVKLALPDPGVMEICQ